MDEFLINQIYLIVQYFWIPGFWFGMVVKASEWNL